MNQSRRTVRCCLVVASLLASAGAGCASVGENVRGIPNVAVVDPAPAALYRGGQPSRAGVETLRAMGVRTVIDLRAEPVPWERAAVEAAGMTYVNIPSVAWDVQPEKVERFLEVIRTCERPAFVHCRHGRDRTGLQVAAYRLVEQPEQWTRAAVIRDLHRHGYHSLMFPGIRRYLTRFDPATFTAPVWAAPPAAPAPQVVVGPRSG